MWIFPIDPDPVNFQNTLRISISTKVQRNILEGERTMDLGHGQRKERRFEGTSKSGKTFYYNLLCMVFFLQRYFYIYRYHRLDCIILSPK